MIESVQNQKVKQWNKLKRKKERMKNNTFLVEGEHLVEEALKSNWNVKELIIRENYDSAWLETYQIPYTTVSEKVFSTLTQTEHPQGIMAEIHMKKHQFHSTGKRMVLLDGVQDPGNVGTIIRTADAFGFDGIVMGNGTVDLFNDKVIRSTQGSLFHLPIMFGDLTNWMDTLKQQEYHIWATALQDAQPLNNEDLPQKLAVIFGNEGNGVQKELLNKADRRVFIPIKGQAESLNVSIASGIIMYMLQC
ncbi:TrmH family RNA methyltransferase [Salinibacillus xinjiangensis]|uniref:RNA methyltransferase n=1 Tax=Salinibacillus xinjiangensis TaxID=1229268 RepID=A0A6G1XA35_9BACI|nr:RNA methyltransferase [Salinibacillus xinjiangensis]MRG87648.1 RNA methyltransferase [Salinibacillus xinjiangensis]